MDIEKEIGETYGNKKYEEDDRGDRWSAEWHQCEYCIQ